MNAISRPLKGMSAPFNYKHLTSADHLYVKQQTNEALSLLRKKRQDRDTFKIAKILVNVRGKLESAQFFAWAETELGLSESIVSKYMKVDKSLGSNAMQLRHVPFGTLYELTLPSTPQYFLDNILSGSPVPSIDYIRAVKKQKEQEPIMIHAEQAKTRELTIQDLASQLVHMQQQIAAMPPQVEEVVKYVTPPEILEENERLRQEATKWHSEWEKIVEDRKIAIEFYEKDRKVMMGQYNTLEEKYEKTVHERDVLIENWKAVSKSNKRMGGKISSLTSLVERFHEEYMQIEKANVLVVDSTVVAKQDGEN